MADARMSDQLDPGEDEGVDGTECVEEKDEVVQRVPAISMAHEGLCAPAAKKKYLVVLLYVRRVSK